MMNPLKYIYVIALLIHSCVDDGKPAAKGELPFVGKRGFETQQGISGTGTPRRLVEIKENGEVEFSFLQINQADKTETKGFYKAGRFKKVIKCVFKEWYNEILYYEITPDKIYLTDSLGNRLRSDDCCYHLEDIGCACESEYYEPFEIQR